MGCSSQDTLASSPHERRVLHSRSPSRKYVFIVGASKEGDAELLTCITALFNVQGPAGAAKMLSSGVATL